MCSRKNAFSAVLLLLALALSLTGSFDFGPHIQTAKAEPYFSDNFNYVADSWTPRLGSWNVTNGEYFVSVEDIGISTVNGLNLTDCVIETQLRFASSLGWEAGIVFRYSDNAHYYAFKIGLQNDNIEIITFDAANPHGNYAKRAFIMPSVGNNSIPINPNVNYILRIEIQGTNFKAYFNGQRVLSWTDNSYSSGLVGLLAWDADVDFDNFKIENATAQPVPTPTPTPTPTPNPTPVQSTPDLVVSCKSTTSYSGFKVEVEGKLTINGNGISNVGILLSYSVSGGNSWNALAFANTGDDGGFSVVWMPSVTGNYLVKATYEGNADYLGTTEIVNFAVTQFAERNVFSVSSNSTVSLFMFHSESRELSFTVTGESETTGYVDMYIAKTIVDNMANVKVYLDNGEVNYTSTSVNDSWLLHFFYQHSTHGVIVILGPKPSQGLLENTLGIAIIIGGILAAAMAVVLVVVVKRRKAKKS